MSRDVWQKYIKVLEENNEELKRRIVALESELYEKKPKKKKMKNTIGLKVIEGHPKV